MWAKTVRISELESGRGWKAERFAAKPEPCWHSAFASERLGELVTERDESVDPLATASAELPYIGLENVEPQSGDLIGVATVRSTGVRSRSKHFLKGDLLYGRLRAYLSKVYLAAEPVEEGLCSGEFYVLRPLTHLVDPEYLRWVLASPRMITYVRGRLAGATHPRLSRDDLFDVVVTTPPLAQQKKLGDYIRHQRERVSALKREAAALPVSTNAVIEQYLKDATSLDELVT